MTTKTLIETMKRIKVSDFFLNDDPEGIYGESGIYLSEDSKGVTELSLQDEQEWDALVQAIFDALGDFVPDGPYSQISGRFTLSGNRLFFEEHRCTRIRSIS